MGFGDIDIAKIVDAGVQIEILIEILNEGFVIGGDDKIHHSLKGGLAFIGSFADFKGPVQFIIDFARQHSGCVRPAFAGQHHMIRIVFIHAEHPGVLRDGHIVKTRVFVVDFYPNRVSVNHAVVGRAGEQTAGFVDLRSKLRGNNIAAAGGIDVIRFQDILRLRAPCIDKLDVI